MSAFTPTPGSVYHVLTVDPDSLEILEGTSAIASWDDAVDLAMVETTKPGAGLVQILEVTSKGAGVIHRLFCSCGSQYYRGQSHRH